jgi:transitional endoplasmic reticulum ATPase
MADDPLKALRDAVRISPENLPLRKHLAQSLMGSGRSDEAVKEYREALNRWPEDVELKVGLAGAFFHLGKNSEALVIVEALIQANDTPAGAYILHARLLLRAGDAERAVREYRKAIDLDPAAKDPELAGRLGIQADERSEVSEGRVRAASSEPVETPDLAIERPAVSFKDVGGMEALKDEIRMKIIHPLNHPEFYKAYGKAVGGGILMYGPPGCGKTHLARATAGEIKAGFLAVGIHDVLDMWIGQSERNLHELFDQARRSAPCVLFFDEVDALGASRSDMRQSSARQLINQFLSELDGVQSSNEGVLVLAATNAPWHLDSAFRRPGRFDRILFVPPPDAAARASILRVLLRGKPCGEIDFDHLAKKSDQFSGADLKGAIDQAIEEKLRAAIKTGTPSPLTTKDLAAALPKVKPTTREWFSSAKNYALYSNQGGLYDDILKYLKL